MTNKVNKQNSCPTTSVNSYTEDTRCVITIYTWILLPNLRFGEVPDNNNGTRSRIRERPDQRSDYYTPPTVIMD